MRRVNHLQTGFSYIEVLIAVIVLGIAFVPAMNALQSGLKASEIQGDYLTQHYHLFGKMEEVLAESFSELDAAATAAGNETTASSYSDATGPDQRQVFLSRYDVDNADADGQAFTGVDDVIWVRSELVGTNLSFETLVLSQ